MTLKIGMAVGLALLAGLGTASAQQTLKVATNATPSPLGGYDAKSKEFDGLAVEFLRLVAKDMKAQIEFVALPAGEQLAALTGKKVDLVAGDLDPAENGPAAKVAEVSNIYASAQDVLVIKDGNKKPFKIAGGLKGVTLAVVKGADPSAELTKLGAKVTAHDTVHAALAAVEAGTAEGAVLFSHIAKAALKDKAHPTLTVVDDFAPTQRKLELAFLLPKGAAAQVGTVNDSIQKLLFDGTGSKVAYKWGLIAEKSFLSEPCACAGAP